MTPQEIFVAHLRRQRQRARVTIEEIADTLRIRPELVEALERNDLSRWPRGVQSRAWVRGYALTVALDPAETVHEFCSLFPEGDRRAGTTLHRMATLADTEAGYRDEFQGPGRRRTDPAPGERRPSWRGEVERLARTLLDRLAQGAFRLRRQSRQAP